MLACASLCSKSPLPLPFHLPLLLAPLSHRLCGSVKYGFSVTRFKSRVNRRVAKFAEGYEQINGRGYGYDLDDYPFGNSSNPLNPNPHSHSQSHSHPYPHPPQAGTSYPPHPPPPPNQTHGDHSHSYPPNSPYNQLGPMYNSNRRDGKYNRQSKQQHYNPHQDYMTMNEPNGPELKYHERKKFQNDRLNTDNKHTYNRGPSNSIPNNDFADHHESSIRNSRLNNSASDPFQSQMNRYQRTYPETNIFGDSLRPDYTPWSAPSQPPSEESPHPEEDEELSEFFKHNNERVDQFTSDREKYGNFYDISKERREQDKKEEDQKKATQTAEKEKEAKKKKKKKGAPSPDEVDANARKYIKMFMLKIHPDFFHNDPVKKAHNMNSLQALNAFLDTITQLRDPTKHVPKERVPLPFNISFHLKDTDKSITTTFHLPKVPVEGVSRMFVDLLRQRAYEGIADMISKAKIKIEDEDKWITENVKEQEKRDFAFSKLPKHWRPIGWSPTDQDYGLIEILMENCRFIDMSEEWRESPYTRHQEEKLAMFVKDFFYFDSLTPEESNKALETFRNCVHVLGFDNWHRIPVVFSTRKGCERLRTTLDYEGFLVFPFDFEVDEATSYLKQNLPAIKQRREELVAKAKQDMLEVEAMKEKLQLTLGPKSIEIEPAVDRDNRRQRLAKYLIRASRAVDISMGHGSAQESILQNDYRQLDFQREQDQEFIDRREGNFIPKHLDDVVMLPLTEPLKFDLPPDLALPSTSAPMLAGPNSSPAPNSTAVPTLSVDSPASTEPATNISTVSGSALTHSAATKGGELNYYQPISSIAPVKLEIDSDESVVGPKLGLGKDAIDSPAVRHGYTGLLLDLDEADRIEQAMHNDQQMAGAVQTYEQRTGIVSGDFYHSSSAMHCLQHLASLATTKFKTDFPWPAIKIVISDHYHLDMTKDEPVLYVPSYFEEVTLRKYMEKEGGSKLLKIQMEAKEMEFFLQQAEKIRNMLKVGSLKISKGLKKSIKDQMQGLLRLEKNANVFALLGDISDLHLVLSDRYATARHYDHPKLFIPFDFDTAELLAYLERGVVPDRYAKRDAQQQEAEAKALDDSFFEEFMGEEYEDEEDYDDEDEDYL